MPAKTRNFRVFPRFLDHVDDPESGCSETSCGQNVGTESIALHETLVANQDISGVPSNRFDLVANHIHGSNRLHRGLSDQFITRPR
jgi:hypothetical protein